MGFSRKKIVTPPPTVEDNNGKFQGCRVKVVGVPGGTPKVVEKTWISSGVNAKKWKIPGGHGKFDWKPRDESIPKEFDILNRGCTIFFLEKPN